MMRSFCVIVLENVHLVDKTVSQYSNYRVLVGNQDSIDKLKAAFGEKVKGSFKV